MSILENHLKFVNEQVIFQQKTIERLLLLKESPAKQKFHKMLLEKFEALSNFLIEQDKKGGNAAIATGKQIRLSLTPADLEGLPEEVLKQLSISEGDRTDFAVLNLLEELGGIASLDQLLIGLYKKTGEVLKRQGLTSRLYRMTQKELIYGVPGKKGIYATRAYDTEETARLFGEGAPSK